MHQSIAASSKANSGGMALPPKRRQRVSESSHALPLLGNRAFLTMLRTSTIQPKTRTGGAGDRFEREADRAAEAVVRMTQGEETIAANLSPVSAGSSIQRKCAECEEEELIQRQPAGGAGPPGIAGAPPVEEMEAAPLIVEDDAEKVGPTQMRKNEFLDSLRGAVCSAVDEGLAGSGQSSSGCPHVEYWFALYAGKPASQVEKAIRRFAPESRGVTAARDYQPIVVDRVRRSVAVWAETGEVTGVPEELSGAAAADAGAPASQGESSGDAVSFQAGPGGAAAPGSPQAVRSRLGVGQSLEGSVRSRMESAFGRKFGNVRVHTDLTGARLSEKLNARAFTVGQHVAFRTGEYRPGTLLGDALIAHELAHVVQQNGAGEPAASPDRAKSRGEGALEEEANRSAASAVVSLWNGPQNALAQLIGRVRPALQSGLSLQRCAESGTQPDCRISEDGLRCECTCDTSGEGFEFVQDPCSSFVKEKASGMSFFRSPATGWTCEPKQPGGRTIVCTASTSAPECEGKPGKKKEFKRPTLPPLPDPRARPPVKPPAGR